MYVFLKSNLGGRMLETLTTSGAIRTIPKKAFALLRIPELSPSELKAARAAFALEVRMHDRIAQALGQLRDARNGYLSSA